MSNMPLLTPTEAENAAPVPESVRMSGSESAVRKSATLGKLVSALVKAQLEFKAVLKDAENPAYTRGNRRSMYATLDSVISATREPLAKHGLVIIALPQEMVEDVRLRITSILIHESGEFIESTMTMTAVDRVTPQELGKLITYARRYQWTSLTGTAPEDDTDGNESSGVGSKEAAQQVAQRKIAASGKKPEQTKVDTLFYVIDKGQGQQGIEWAEFFNVAAYLASNQDREHEVRYAFSAQGAKKTKDEQGAKVNTEKLDALLQVLAGDMGIKVEQLEAR